MYSPWRLRFAFYAETDIINITEPILGQLRLYIVLRPIVMYCSWRLLLRSKLRWNIELSLYLVNSDCICNCVIKVMATTPAFYAETVFKTEPVFGQLRLYM